VEAGRKEGRKEGRKAVREVGGDGYHYRKERCVYYYYIYGVTQLIQLMTLLINSISNGIVCLLVVYLYQQEFRQNLGVGKAIFLLKENFCTGDTTSQVAASNL